MYSKTLLSVAGYIFYVTISNMSLLVSFGKDKSDGACGIESSQPGYLEKYLSCQNKNANFFFLLEKVHFNKPISDFDPKLPSLWVYRLNSPASHIEGLPDSHISTVVTIWLRSTENYGIPGKINFIILILVSFLDMVSSEKKKGKKKDWHYYMSGVRYWVYKTE